MINEWFDKLETFLKEINIYDAPDLSSRLWNADETGFCTSIASHRVLAKKGSKEVHETSGGSGRDYFTVLGAGAADGTMQTSSYKGRNLYLRWTTGGPAGAVYSVSDSGCSKTSYEMLWLQRLLPQLLDKACGIQSVYYYWDHKPLNLPGNSSLVTVSPSCQNLFPGFLHGGPYTPTSNG